MSTSDKNYMLRLSLYHLIAAIFCAVFGGIYELFSHGVYAYFMIYAFLFPLVLGTLPFLVMGMKARRGKDHDKRCMEENKEGSEDSYEELHKNVHEEESETAHGKNHVYFIRFWVSGIAVLTVGSLLQGVLTIFGTTNRLAIAYPVAGIMFLVLGLVFRRKALKDGNADIK